MAAARRLGALRIIDVAVTPLRRENPVSETEEEEENLSESESEGE